MFAQKLKQIMVSGGLTQQDLAALLGVSQPAVSLYLRGRIPPAEILLKLAEISRKNMEWFISESGTATASTVHEPQADYGMEQKLVSYWRKLTPEIRRNLLALMHQLIKNQDNNL